MNQGQPLEAKLARITRLLGADESFYVLALHSFVEDWLRHEKGYGEGPGFVELVRKFGDELLAARGGAFIEGLSCLGSLARQHLCMHRVRRRFEALDPEEAIAATHLFLAFCRLAGLDRLDGLDALERHLDAWKRRAPPLEQPAAIRAMQAEIEGLAAGNKELLAEGARCRALRAQPAASDRGEREGLAGELAALAPGERYLHLLGRLTVYARSRMDYERSIAQLTPEQEEAAEAVRLRATYLIRGGPGTGKSLVLLESLRRFARQQALDFGEGENVVLVTFARTLVKYDRRLAELMRLDLPLEVITTLDSLFLRKLQAIEPAAACDLALLEKLIGAERAPSFLAAEELRGEIEGLLFGWALTRREYVEEIIPREGMRRRLTQRQREEVWRVREEVVAEMEARRLYTAGYGRLKLLEHLRAHPGDRSLRDIATLFLDEVQDLTPAALAILRELTRGAIVMAGDTDQSLYNPASPFGRAGLSMRGLTRVLRTNFRNTAQIHRLAERFRERSAHLGWEWESEGRPLAFREGPAPELYLAADAEEAAALLVEKLRLLVEQLGCEPGSVCVLVPREVEIAPMLERLAAAGHEGIDVSGEPFAFADRGRVRVSTLHTGKGIDFPVVLMYVPYLPRREHLDQIQGDRLVRNLVYVGITRAMDSLDVFAVESTARQDAVLAALLASFGR